jgi:hypothetical protein
VNSYNSTGYLWLSVVLPQSLWHIAAEFAVINRLVYVRQSLLNAELGSPSVTVLATMRLQNRSLSGKEFRRMTAAAAAADASLFICHAIQLNQLINSPQLCH